jgi:hypothetical protein
LRRSRRLPKSDRIEYAPPVVDDNEESESRTKKDAAEELQTDQRTVRVVTGKPRRLKGAPAEQLSFLKFAVENGNGTPDKSKEQDVKERLL